MDKKASQERTASSSNGFVYVAIGLVAVAVSIFLLATRPSPMIVGVFVLGMLVGVWCLAGL